MAFLCVFSRYLAVPVYDLLFFMGFELFGVTSYVKILQNYGEAV